MQKKKPITFCKNPLTIKDFDSLPQDEDAILLDDEEDRCLIRIRTENGWQYWLKRFCPYPWFNLAKAGAEYAILLAWPEY